MNSRAGGTVLLVDDDPALLDALTAALSIRLPSVSTHTSDGAASALRLVAAQSYDAVVSDVKMPGIDGLELLARIGEIDPDVPVLLITGHGENDLAIQALRAGAYDLIPKPIDRDYLVAALVRAIERRQLRRELEAQGAELRQRAAELEWRVEERTRELVQANRVKDEFLGLISHELRTPLTVILGHAELLQLRGDALDADVRRQAVADLQVEAQRLQRVIENLLVLSRLDYGAETESEPALLRHVLTDDAVLHASVDPNRRVVVTFPEEPTLVLAEPTHIELVVRNLLSNAEKYSPPDEAIEVRIEPRDDEVAVRVLDRGEGIRPEEADAIFRPFYRSPFRSSAAFGMGIGLAVCQRLVEAHGGRIWACPRDDGGSEFGFSFPALLPDDEEPAAESAAPTAGRT
jgi:signal transduction histidine kinase